MYVVHYCYTSCVVYCTTYIIRRTLLTVQRTHDIIQCTLDMHNTVNRVFPKVTVSYGYRNEKVRSTFKMYARKCTTDNIMPTLYAIQCPHIVYAKQCTSGLITYRMSYYLCRISYIYVICRMPYVVCSKSYVTYRMSYVVCASANRLTFTIILSSTHAYRI